MSAAMDCSEVHAVSHRIIPSNLLVDVVRAPRLDNFPAKFMHPLLSSLSRNSSICITRIVKDSESASDDWVDPFRGFMERVVDHFIRAFLPDTNAV